MTTATIPQPVVLPRVGPSTDPAYQYEGHIGRNIARFGVTLTDTRVGMQLATGERFGYVFSGFIPTAQTVVGSAVSLRMLGTTLTFKLVDGQVKERIRWATLADATARLTIGLSTASCHFEQAANGGLEVWSDTGAGLVATIPPPTIADANGRSDGAIRYALAADGKSVDLLTDATWLATAAFPVFIDPTTITSANLDANALAASHAEHVFKMSDGRLVAIWRDTVGSLYRSTSTDGVTWTAPVAVFTPGVPPSLIAACSNGDNIYGVMTGGAALYAFKSIYAAGAFTDTGPTIITLTNPASQNFDYADCKWDNVKSAFHVGLASSGSSGVWAVAFSTALAKVAEYFGSGLGVAIAVDGAATPNVYLGYSSGVNTTVLPMTFSGTAYTTGTAETAIAGDNRQLALTLDQNANLDVVALVSTALKTAKRTGLNTYSAVTTIAPTNVLGAPSIARTGNVNADIFVLYQYYGAQGNGEIYYVKRTGGAWGSVTLLAGGANTGWQSPTAIGLIPTDAKVHTLYVTGVSPNFNVVYDGSLVNGSAPSAPINVLPTGLANTSLTPTCSCTYKNPATTDGLGKYRVLVTRQSDSVVMWDTGSAGTNYTGASIIDGGTFSIVYAGTALAKGITYLIQFQFWDANGGLAGPLSTAVTFQINDAPTINITSSATPTTSGPTITWTYSQTLNHAQSTYQITVSRGGTQVYDSGVQSGAATSFALPVGTLTNGVAHVVTLIAKSTDGL